MKLTVKCASILALLLLASPLILLKGCGNAVNGGDSGACPDTVAPAGSKITAPSSLGPPFVTVSTCYAGKVAFTVTDAGGNPMNGICVVINTDAAIALTTPGDLDCANVIASPQRSIITRTDKYGVVSVDLVTAPTATGLAHFVDVTSGALTSEVVTATATGPL
jgi:hypothetical protein